MRKDASGGERGEGGGEEGGVRMFVLKGLGRGAAFVGPLCG
jgi:hypothetical protein